MSQNCRGAVDENRGKADLADIVGLVLRADRPLMALKLAAVWLLTLFASAMVSQLIARAMRRAGPPL